MTTFSLRGGRAVLPPMAGKVVLLSRPLTVGSNLPRSPCHPSLLLVLPSASIDINHNIKRKLYKGNKSYTSLVDQPSELQLISVKLKYNSLGFINTNCDNPYLTHAPEESSVQVLLQKMKYPSLVSKCSTYIMINNKIQRTLCCYWCCLLPGTSVYPRHHT